jgi:hypothetical protein
MDSIKTGLLNERTSSTGWAATDSNMLSVTVAAAGPAGEARRRSAPLEKSPLPSATPRLPVKKARRVGFVGFIGRWLDYEPRGSPPVCRAIS